MAKAINDIGTLATATFSDTAICLSAPGVKTFTAGKVSIAITHSAP